MKQFAVIGHPIGHSLSPLMHNTAFRLLKLDYNYKALEIDPANLKTSVDTFRESQWGGVNVTTPHKETIMPLLNKIDSDAYAIGAVNTVVNNNGELIGYNTDVIGVRRSLGIYRVSIEGDNCLILGAGGAARSVAYVLVHDFKPKAITFWAQFPLQAQAIIKCIGSSEVKFDIVDSSQEALEMVIKDCSLVVNTTTVGMFPRINESPVHDQRLLTSQHTIFDLVYRPLKTQLLDHAEAAGARTTGGLEMFVHQGAAAFRLWTGMEMPLEQVRQVLVEKLTSDVG